MASGGQEVQAPAVAVRAHGREREVAHTYRRLDQETGEAAAGADEHLMIAWSCYRDSTGMTSSRPSCV